MPVANCTTEDFIESSEETQIPVEPHAVRWASRRVRGELQFTKWHYTDNASFTACELPILLAVATLLPETEDVEYVDCKRCLSKLRNKGEG